MDPLSIREKADLVALRSLPGATNRRLREMLAVFGSPSGVWEAIRAGKVCAGTRDDRTAEWRDLSRSHDHELELESMQAGGIHAVVRGEEAYPPLLAETADAPLVLFYRGRLPNTEAVSVAIVGSRKATPYGLEVARLLGREIGRAGVNVVSGAAYGIDSAAHHGSLEDSAFTTAVLGCGVDVVYPRTNFPLLERIVSCGCILSEYPPGTLPLKQNFPARNRIIAGISRAVVVVEAAENSGALLTVDYALGEGREVFAVPGQIFSRNSSGTNALVRGGAIAVTSPDDVLSEIGVKRAAIRNSGENAEARRVYSTTERRLFDVLSSGPSDVDEISMATGLKAPETLSLLSRMEVDGNVARDSGGRYHLTAR